MANDPWEDLIDFGNTVEGDAALASDPVPQDEFAGMVDFSAQPAPQQAPPQNPREALFMPQRQGVQPTGPRPWGSLAPKAPEFDMSTAEGRGRSAAYAMGNLAQAPDRGWNWITEGAATQAAGLNPESYEFTPDGYVKLTYPNGEKSTWAITDDHVPEALVGEFVKEYGGLPADPEGNPITPVIGMKPRDYELIGAQVPDEVVGELRNRDWFNEDVDAFARGAALGFDDEIDAVVGSTLYGESFDDALRRSRAIRDYDQRENPWARTAGAITGSLALPTKAGVVARPAAREAYVAAFRSAIGNGADQAAARAFAREAAGSAVRRAVTGQVAKEGAGYGAAYGAAEGDSWTERGLGAVTGGTEGGAFGGLAGAAATQARRFIPNRGPSSSAVERRQFDAATERMADRGMPVDFMAADRPGAIKSQVATSVANSTVGVLPVSEAADRNIASLRGAIGDTADSIGTVRNNEYDLGRSVQRGVGSFIDAGERRVDELYNRVPISPDRPANLTNVRKYLDDANAGFTSNQALSNIWSRDPKLQQTAAALAQSAKNGGNLSWNDLKAFRSQIGEKIGQPGLASDGVEMRRLRGLYGALSEDMRATAQASGPDALRAFERANGFKRGMAQRTERVFSELLGNDYQNSPESAIRTLLQWGKAKNGDAGRLGQAFRSLPDETADSVRASILDMLGTATKGRQNATGDVFSPSDFVSNWNDLSPRAKAILFNGEHRATIDDIVKIASGMKASSRFANTSRTGLVSNIATGTGLSGIAGFLANPVAGVMTLGAQFGLGKLMASPRFARWLVALDKKPNDAAIRAHIKRLGKFSTSGGIQAQEYLDLSDQLLQELDATNGEQR